MAIIIGKWNIFKVLLFVLFFPLLAFDIFLFYNDTPGDLEVIGELWLITFLVSLIFYLCKQKITTEKTLLLQIIELIFFSFVVLFFVVNILLASLFLWIMQTSDQFLI